MANEKEAGEVDLDAVNKLVAALQCDVEKLRGDSPDIQRLKDELQTLRNVLDSLEALEAKIKEPKAKEVKPEDKKAEAKAVVKDVVRKALPTTDGGVDYLP